MNERTTVAWKCRDRRLDFTERPLLMGILNVTPDSFSDGGQYLDASRAVARGLELAAQGADIIDVGGESTRPGATPVDAAEEARRVVPVIRELARATGATLSVDTTKAVVAREAVAAGAAIINDVTAMTNDPDMPAVAADTGAGAVLMHMQGTPRTMQQAPRYGDVVAEVSAYLRARMAELTARGVAAEALAVDPGIGFGKTLEHNLALLAHLDALTRLGAPVVVGISRKSFLGRLTGAPVEDRLAASLGALVVCILNGAHVMRVHDVKESHEALRAALAVHSGRAA